MDIRPQAFGFDGTHNFDGSKVNGNNNIPQQRGPIRPGAVGNQGGQRDQLTDMKAYPINQGGQQDRIQGGLGSFGYPSQNPFGGGMNANRGGFGNRGGYGNPYGGGGGFRQQPPQFGAVAALETLTEIEADLVEALAAAVCVAATVAPHNSAVDSEEATAEEWVEDSVADSDSNLLCLAVVD